MTQYIPVLALVLSLPFIGATIVDTVQGVVNEFWNQANPPGSTTIDSTELSDFIGRYKENASPGDPLQILEYHFTEGSQNWTNDFASQGVNYRFSRAYYRSFDVFNFGAPFIRYITFEDMDQIIDLIHVYLYGDTSNSGFLTEDEFGQGFNELIFRNLPFGLLFVDYVGETILPGMFEELDPDGFDSIFTNIDSNGDNELTPQELEVYWEEGEYGSSETAIELFTRLDLDSDSILTRSDWTDLFNALDCRMGNWYKNRLELREFYQLDLILHDVIPHPRDSGNCTLAVIPGFRLAQGSYKAKYFD